MISTAMKIMVLSTHNKFIQRSQGSKLTRRNTTKIPIKLKAIIQTKEALRNKTLPNTMDPFPKSATSTILTTTRAALKTTLVKLPKTIQI